MNDGLSTRLNAYEVAASGWECGFLLPRAELHCKLIIHCECLERSQLPDCRVARRLWLRFDDDDTGNRK